MSREELIPIIQVFEEASGLPFDELRDTWWWPQLCEEVGRAELDGFERKSEELSMYNFTEI